MITGPEHQMRMRPMTRMRLCAAGSIALLAVAVGPLVYAATARAIDGDYYEFCKNNLRQPDSVCCTNSGGVPSNGVCADPAAPPTPLPTITQQILPPVISAPH